jgi:hypothetical protein
MAPDVSFWYLWSYLFPLVSCFIKVFLVLGLNKGFFGLTYVRYLSLFGYWSITGQIRSKRVHLLTLLAVFRTTMGLGTRMEGLTAPLTYYHTLSRDLRESLDEISQSLLGIQGQVDSLSMVTLQNHCNLNLLTVKNMSFSGKRMPLLY